MAKKKDRAAARQLRVKGIDTAKLIPYARNARLHTEPQVAAVAGSIREFGWTNPVLVAPDLTIIAGHCRVLAAHLLGMGKVPCIVLAGMSDVDVKALRLADNKLALNAAWDEELLTLELKELKIAGVDLGLVGFDEGELQMLFELPDDADGKEYDESCADDVKQVECPSCGHEFPI